MRLLKTDQYDRWFKKLKDVKTRAAINARLRRIEFVGELIGDWKAIGGKIVELRFDIGPGYRVYAHKHWLELILLLIGGDKSSQQADIRKAQELLREWEAQDGR